MPLYVVALHVLDLTFAKNMRIGINSATQRTSEVVMSRAPSETWHGQTESFAHVSELPVANLQYLFELVDSHLSRGPECIAGRPI